MERFLRKQASKQASKQAFRSQPVDDEIDRQNYGRINPKISS
ncbi:hypothetical protein [Leptospirillum ferrooxidans]|nr:hypothetical protein [Leptospirillum ferrooxidans]